MSGKMQWYLVAYDIREPARLRRVAKHLKGFGERVQYSIFRCHLRKRELERLRWELLKLIAADDDLLIIGLCSSCVSRINIKSGDTWPESIPGYEII